jgi:hypothetical protein
MSTITAVEIILPNTFITMTNNNGDKGSPYLRPQELLKKGEGVPYTKPRKYHEQSKYTISPLKPLFLSKYNKKIPIDVIIIFFYIQFAKHTQLI